jgi:hypothetical protein
MGTRQRWAFGVDENIAYVAVGKEHIAYVAAGKEYIVQGENGVVVLEDYHGCWRIPLVYWRIPLVRPRSKVRRFISSLLVIRLM